MNYYQIIFLIILKTLYNSRAYEYRYVPESIELDNKLMYNSISNNSFNNLINNNKILNNNKFIPKFNLHKTYKNSQPIKNKRYTNVDYKNDPVMFDDDLYDKTRYDVIKLSDTNRIEVYNNSNSVLSYQNTFVNQTHIIPKFPIYFTNPSTGIIYAINEVGFNFTMNDSLSTFNTNYNIPIYIPKDQYDRDMQIMKLKLKNQCKKNLSDKIYLYKNQTNSNINFINNKLPILSETIKIKKPINNNIPIKLENQINSNIKLKPENLQESSEEDSGSFSNPVEALGGILGQVYDVVDNNESSSSEENENDKITNKISPNKKFKTKDKLQITPTSFKTGIKNKLENDGSSIEFITQLENPSSIQNIFAGLIQTTTARTYINVPLKRPFNNKFNLLNKYLYEKYNNTVFSRRNGDIINGEDDGELSKNFETINKNSTNLRISLPFLIKKVSSNDSIVDNTGKMLVKYSSPTIPTLLDKMNHHNNSMPLKYQEFKKQSIPNESIYFNTITSNLNNFLIGLSKEISVSSELKQSNHYGKISKRSLGHHNKGFKKFQFKSHNHELKHHKKSKSKISFPHLKIIKEIPKYIKSHVKDKIKKLKSKFDPKKLKKLFDASKDIFHHVEKRSLSSKKSAQFYEQLLKPKTNNINDSFFSSNITNDIKVNSANLNNKIRPYSTNEITVHSSNKNNGIAVDSNNVTNEITVDLPNSINKIVIKSSSLSNKIVDSSANSTNKITVDSNNETTADSNIATNEIDSPKPTNNIILESSTFTNIIVDGLSNSTIETTTESNNTTNKVNSPNTTNKITADSSNKNFGIAVHSKTVTNEITIDSPNSTNKIVIKSNSSTNKIVDSSYNSTNKIAVDSTNKTTADSNNTTNEIDSPNPTSKIIVESSTLTNKIVDGSSNSTNKIADDSSSSTNQIPTDSNNTTNKPDSPTTTNNILIKSSSLTNKIVDDSSNSPKKIALDLNLKNNNNDNILQKRDPLHESNSDIILKNEEFIRHPSGRSLLLINENEPEEKSLNINDLKLKTLSKIDRRNSSRFLSNQNNLENSKDIHYSNHEKDNSKKNILSTQIHVTSEYKNPDSQQKSSNEEYPPTPHPKPFLDRRTPPCDSFKSPNDKNDDDDYYYDFNVFNDYGSYDDDDDDDDDDDKEKDISDDVNETYEDSTSTDSTESHNNDLDSKKLAHRKRKNIEKRNKKKKIKSNKDNDDDDDQGVGMGELFGAFTYPFRLIFLKFFEKTAEYVGYKTDRNDNDNDNNEDDNDPLTNDIRKPKYPQYTIYNNNNNDKINENNGGGWFSSWFNFGKDNAIATDKNNNNNNEASGGWFDYLFDYDERSTTPSTSIDDYDYGSWFYNWFDTTASKQKKISAAPTSTTSTTTSVPILTIANPMKNPQKWIGILAQHIVDSTSSSASTPEANNEELKVSTYDKYQIWRLKPDEESKVKALDHFKQNEDGSKIKWLQGPTLRGLTDVLIPFQMLTDFQGTLNFEGISHEVLIFDVGKAIEYENTKEHSIQNAKKTKNNIISEMVWNRYHSYDDITRFIETLQFRNPEIVELFHIGRSYEGRPLVIVKISTKQEPTKKKTKLKQKGNQNGGVFIESGIYAREWIAPATSTWIINELVKVMKDNRTSPDINFIKKSTWYIMPVLNPDGYEYSRHYDRMWRKSRSKHISKPNNILSSAMEWLQQTNSEKLCYGVDLDQNWEYGWDGKGGSKSPCNEYFIGPSTFSEPETRAVSKFLMDHRKKIKLFISLKAYGQIISYPNKFNTTFNQQKLDELLDVAMVGNDGLRKSGSLSRYKIDSSNDLVTVNSGSSNYFAMYEAGVPFSYTIHLGDNGVHGYLLPSSNIESTSQDAFEIIKAILDYI